MRVAMFEILYMPCLLYTSGCAVSEVAQKVQSSVFAALEGMTGFQVNAVNVHVGGISFD